MSKTWGQNNNFFGKGCKNCLIEFLGRQQSRKSREIQPQERMKQITTHLRNPQLPRNLLPKKLLKNLTPHTLEKNLIKSEKITTKIATAKATKRILTNMSRPTCEKQNTQAQILTYLEATDIPST